MEALIPLIILLPFLGATIIGLSGLTNPSFRKQETLIGIIATSCVAIPFFIILGLFLGYQKPIDYVMFSWMKTKYLSVNFGYLFDELSLLMGMIVTGIGALIHIYSIGYMHGDSGFYKFFLYLNLFIFAMLNLVLGDNLMVTFLGWEGVGVCSYFLIGFWFTDMEKAKAAQKAFIANRIGDFAFLVAVFIIFSQVHTLDYTKISVGGDAAFWVGLLIFAAATGKSAQIPLYVWLPDAMAGPTPVSALIHAATMVTSGIYLIARLSGAVFAQAPEVLSIVAVVGAATAIMAALIAIAQNDIKKVLAYSTVSQLGFMFMALGAGAYSTAIFHVMTHAFFKACLFLGSGSVIHSMDHTHAVDDPQDIRTMGNLRKYMPATSLTFWISTIAIAGIPPLAGFFSKDEILGKTFARGLNGETVYYFVFIVGIVTALLTAFYMTRVTYLTFNGKERFALPAGGHSHAHSTHGNVHSDHGHANDSHSTHDSHDSHHGHHEVHGPHESPATMTLPLWILAGLACIGGFFGLPEVIGHGHFNWISHMWLASESGPVKNLHVPHPSVGIEIVLITLSIIIAAFGVYLSFSLYSKHGIEGDKKVMKFFGSTYKTLQNKFYVDEFYNKVFIRPFVWISEHFVLAFDKQIIDGVVNGTGTGTQYLGNILRKIQTGFVQNYALIMVAGVVVAMLYFMNT